MRCNMQHTETEAYLVVKLTEQRAMLDGYIKECEQLERETSWLAKTILNNAYVINGKPACPPDTKCNWVGYGPSPSIEDCAECWRKAAKKAIEAKD